MIRKGESNPPKKLIYDDVILPAFADQGELVWVCNGIGCDIAALVVRVFTTIGAAVTVTHAAIAFGQILGREWWNCCYRLQEKRDKPKKAMLHDYYVKGLG